MNERTNQLTRPITIPPGGGGTVDRYHMELWKGLRRWTRRNDLCGPWSVQYYRCCVFGAWSTDVDAAGRSQAAEIDRQTE